MSTQLGYSQYTLSQNDGQGILWQHVDLINENGIKWLENESALDPMIIEALSAEETRPRSFKSKNGIVVILRVINLIKGDEPEDMVSIRVWLDANRIVTTARRDVVSIDDMARDIGHGDGPATTTDFLLELIDKLADRIGDFIEKLEEKLEGVELTLEDAQPDQMRNVLSVLRRQIVTVRRYLAPQRDALDRLAFIDKGLFNEHEQLFLREESDRVSRYLEDIDLARERAIVIHESYLTQITQQQNNRMYALSIITAVFLPLSFFTGLLGINVAGIPGTENASAFGFVCAGLGVMAIIIALLFKKIRWL